MRAGARGRPEACVGMVSAGRPRAAARALASVMDHGGLAGRDAPRLLVHDGAEHEVADYAAALRSAGVDRVEILSVPERKRMAFTLSRSVGLEPALLDWALVGTPDALSTGSARNVLELLGGGRDIFSIDDDVVVLPPGGATADVRRFRIARTGESPRMRLGVRAPEMSGAAEPLLDALGRKLADSAVLVGLLAGTDDGRAAEPLGASVVMPRLTGQTAFDTPFWNLFFGRSDHDYARHRLTRHVSVDTDACLLFRDYPFVSCAALYDGERILPPWPARGRSSDSAFATALGAAHGGHAFCLSDVAVEHRADRPEFDESALWLATGAPCGSAVVAATLREIRSAIDAGHERPVGGALLRTLGLALREYADEPRALELRRVAEGILEARARACEELVARTETDSQRRHDAHAALARLHATLGRGEAFPPRDYPQRGAAFAAEVRRYADLLVAWPDVWVAARELWGGPQECATRHAGAHPRSGVGAAPPAHAKTT